MHTHVTVCTLTCLCKWDMATHYDLTHTHTNHNSLRRCLYTHWYTTHHKSSFTHMHTHAHSLTHTHASPMHTCTHSLHLHTHTTLTYTCFIINIWTYIYYTINHIAKSDKSDIDILMPTLWYMVHAHTHHTHTLRRPFFAGTNVWYFCGLAQKTQNFVPANIIYLQYRTLGFINPVPFQCINHKI